MNILTKASYSNIESTREKTNAEIAYNAAVEGIVLLENKGVLPLTTKKLALYGAGATRTSKGGTGSGEVNERHSVNVLEGLEHRGFTITTKKWIEDYEKVYLEGERAFNEKRTKSLLTFNIRYIISMMFANYIPTSGRVVSEEDLTNSDTDTCVYVVTRQAGEGNDRRLKQGDYLLTDEEIASINICSEHYKNFILVINSGAYLDLSPLKDNTKIGAILYICQLGMQGGYALADVLTGKVNPSGKLTDTWVMQYDDIPYGNEYSYLNGNLKREYYKEGIYVGYRYYDSFNKEVLYPFGYGLSYTAFELRNTTMSINGSKCNVGVEVVNTGTYEGKEVVEVYVSAPSGKLHKVYQELVGFKKTSSLKPNESEVISVSFDFKDVASYDEELASYILEKGEYVVRVGNSSRNTSVVGVGVLASNVVISKHTSVCALPEKFDELVGEARNEVIDDSVVRYAIDLSDYNTVTYTYEKPTITEREDVRAWLNKLSLTDMIHIVCGIGQFGGKTSFTLPGSVGNTTSKFWDKGLANMTLCDGPAGLRIQQQSIITDNGKIKGIGMSMSMYDMLPKFIRKFLVDDSTDKEILYQYTTAFPVTTVLAQTWNSDLLYEVGKAIYSEMKEYGCTYWLAPAINIHRNTLCGRNFEYFSEDPYLTGALASALTKGVQQEEGYYVCVKHYACNNQEDNRNLVSSVVGERALREIYLKAFKMVISDGKGKSVMSSYNRVNDVYAPNSYDLCTKLLRNEWKFEGVVMTDWFSTAPTQASTSLCMKAGNDLLMPGGRMFRVFMYVGLLTGKISKDDLRLCASRVITQILDSNIQREYKNK